MRRRGKRGREGNGGKGRSPELKVCIRPYVDVLNSQWMAEWLRRSRSYRWRQPIWQKNVCLYQVRCAGAHPHSQAFKPARVNPIKLAYDTHVSRMAGPIATSAFNQHYASMPAVLIQGHCYAELAVSSLAVTQNTASTRCAYPRRDGKADQAWVALINTRIRSPIHHPSTNRARRRATMLIKTDALPLSQTATQQTYIKQLIALCTQYSDVIFIRVVQVKFLCYVQERRIRYRSIHRTLLTEQMSTW